MQNLKIRPEARLSDFYMIFGGLEALCTSILNPLYFLSEIQYDRRTERHLDLRLLDQKFPVKYQNINHLDTTISQ